MAAPYGPPISTAQAKVVAAAALAEARAHQWAMAAAVTDPNGTLVYFEKIDDTQHGSPVVAIEKARSAALFKRPTKAFQDNVAGGGAGLRALGIPGACPIDGGLPLMIDGQIVGGLGVSGALPEQDAQCAQAGASALQAS